MQLVLVNSSISCKQAKFKNSPLNPPKFFLNNTLHSELENLESMRKLSSIMTLRNRGPEAFCFLPGSMKKEIWPEMD